MLFPTKLAPLFIMCSLRLIWKSTSSLTTTTKVQGRACRTAGKRERPPAPRFRTTMAGSAFGCCCDETATRDTRVSVVSEPQDSFTIQEMSRDAHLSKGSSCLGAVGGR
eukprot:scaffold569_cov408-Prasinococcus_capsulatus_cf.AAC.30